MCTAVCVCLSGGGCFVHMGVHIKNTKIPHKQPILCVYIKRVFSDLRGLLPYSSVTCFCKEKMQAKLSLPLEVSDHESVDTLIKLTC